ncbi:hypothetical protein T08_7640 [Trichinella sp. T8]|nr:hypothetical protein T08_7640 [Trichinella sp. T8]
MDTNEHRLITTQKPTTFAHTTVRRSLTKTAAFITSSSLTYRTPTTVLMVKYLYLLFPTEKRKCAYKCQQFSKANYTTSHCSAADTDRANEIFPAENEDEDTEATRRSTVVVVGDGGVADSNQRQNLSVNILQYDEVARSVFVFTSSSTLVSDCLIKYISIVCCFVVAMPSGKRETERKVNAPVDTGPSPNSDERVNNPTEGADEPARESGSLQINVKIFVENRNG